MSFARNCATTCSQVGCYKSNHVYFLKRMRLSIYICIPHSPLLNPALFPSNNLKSLHTQSRLRTYLYIGTYVVLMARTKQTRRPSREPTKIVGLSRCKFPVQRTSDGTPIEALRDIEFASVIQCFESVSGSGGYQVGRGIIDPDEIIFITCKAPQTFVVCLTQTSGY